MTQLARRLLRPLVLSVRAFYLRVDIVRLSLTNRSSHQSVTEPEGPVVSLTTHSKRLKTVHLTIESIARGHQRPSRLILWLDNPSQFADLPIQLKRLQARGLEVKLSDKNYGPHEKYYPYLLSRESDNQTSANRPLVTADDDILYPRRWLRDLLAAYRKAPDLVQCYRARVVNLTESALAPYSTWELCRSDQPSFLHCALGVSGVIYPPRLQDLIKLAGDSFEQSCPRADDLWLHVQAVRNGFQIRQLSPNPIHFPIVPGTEQQGLQHQNLHNQGNDEQARKTYGVADINRLWSAANSSSSSASS